MAKIRTSLLSIQIYFLLFFYERGFPCSESGCKYTTLFFFFANGSAKFFILFCKRLNMCLVKDVWCWTLDAGCWMKPGLL